MISCCIPTYNGETYLAESVASVLDQDSDDLELIIVDDASTDGTYRLAQQLAAQDSRIRLFANPRNLGLVANWNRCLDHSRGEWIKFIFQDDRLESNCLTALRGLAQATGARFLLCERDLQFEDGVEPRLQRWFETRFLRFSDVFSVSRAVSNRVVCHGILRHFGKNFFGEPTCVMVHRDCFARYGAFNTQLIQLCDYEYWCRVACNEGLAYLPEKLASFRVHSGSASSASELNSMKQFHRDTLDPLAIGAACLLDPLYEPLRQATPRAVARLEGEFLSALLRARRRVDRAATSGDREILATHLSGFIESNPTVKRLEQEIPRWRYATHGVRRTLARLWRHVPTNRS